MYTVVAFEAMVTEACMNSLRTSQSVILIFTSLWAFSKLSQRSPLSSLGYIVVVLYNILGHWEKCFYCLLSTVNADAKLQLGTNQNDI